MPEVLSSDVETCRELIDSLPAIVWRASADASHFTFVSSYAETLLGFPLRRWTEERAFWSDRIYPEDRAFIAAARRNRIRAAGSYDLEYRMVAAEGRAVWVREIGFVTPAGDLAGVIVDLSQKRSAPEALSETKLWLRQVIDTIPQQIWSGPPDGTVDFVNERWSCELSITLEQVRQNPATAWQRMLHPDDRGRVMQAWSDSVATGAPYEQEERHRTAGGEYRWYLSRGVPLRDEQRRIIRWFGTNTDIELQKRAEEELRRSEQRWRAVFDNSLIGVALMDTSMRFVDVNAAYEKMAGRPMAELHGLTCMDLTHEDDRTAYRIVQDELISGKREHFEMEKRYRRPDGSVIWVHTHGSRLPAAGGDGPLWVVVIEDITERKRLRDELERDRDWLRLLVDLAHQFTAKLEVPSVVDAVLAGLQQRALWEWAVIFLPEPGTRNMKVYLNSADQQGFFAGDTIPIEGTVSGKVFESGQPIVFRQEDLPTLAPEYNRSAWLRQVVSRQEFKRGCALPLVFGGKVLGVLLLGNSTEREIDPIDVGRWQELAQFVAAALHNAFRYDEVNSSRERLATERGYIEEQIRLAYDIEQIVGRSSELHEVLRQVRTVAPTDSGVLIVGETGTGKELIARAIHDNSARRDQPFIKVDCAAIPASLLESELFGHERGAFTGAVAQKAGRLEIADKGTLFLDEVGEIPLELQTKLLRVLQDQTFERLGSNRTVRLDVRVIAATNRDLEELVSKGEFRADLYYRLKVFPIVIPPLRDRPSDIPPLVQHYVRKYARRMRKAIEVIPPAAMHVFTRYPWPGNVRELQHFIERSVILTSGPVLQAPLKELEAVIRKRKGAVAAGAPARTMEQIERESIVQALRESNWVVGGPDGAAARLGLKRTTLASRMERLGISRRRTA
jgi:formate hydrogenlyase transcriptional activator